MNPYLEPRPPVDVAAIAEFNSGVLFAREQYQADADDAERRRIARAENQRRYRERKRGAK